jgi:hypothetical protein
VAQSGHAASLLALLWTLCRHLRASGGVDEAAGILLNFQLGSLKREDFMRRRDFLTLAAAFRCGCSRRGQS